MSIYSANSRKNWIDICRGVGILFVLLGHNNPPFIRYIFAFHMPFFFLISGYLYKDSEDNGFLYAKKLAKRYLLPYLFLSVINLILHMANILVATRNIEYLNASEMFRFIRAIIIVDIDNMPGCGQLWFLPSLAISLFLFRTIRTIPVSYVRMFIYIALAAITHFLQDNMLMFSLHTVPIAVVFIAIGHYMKERDLLNKLTKDVTGVVNYYKGIFCIVILHSVGIVFEKMNASDLWIDINVARFGFIPVTIISAVAISLSYFAFFFMFCEYMSFVGKAFAYIGRHTLFFLGFDTASNTWGATLLSLLKIGLDLSWYSAFAIRMVVIFTMYLIWIMIRYILLIGVSVHVNEHESRR